MSLYQETDLDETRYLHDAAYHANRELVRKLVEADVLRRVDGPVYQPDYMLAMVTYLMESGQRTTLRDIRVAVDAALGLVEAGKDGLCQHCNGAGCVACSAEVGEEPG
jgi:hypothetical protein